MPKAEMQHGLNLKRRKNEKHIIPNPKINYTIPLIPFALSVSSVGAEVEGWKSLHPSTSALRAYA